MALHSLITFDYPQSLITPRHLECQGPRLMTTSARSSWIVRPCAGLWNFYGAMAASWPGLENAGNCYGKFDSGSLEDSGYCIGRIERIELIHMDLRLQTETALEGRWSTVLGSRICWLNLHGREVESSPRFFPMTLPSACWRGGCSWLSVSAAPRWPKSFREAQWRCSRLNWHSTSTRHRHQDSPNESLKVNSKACVWSFLP